MEELKKKIKITKKYLRELYGVKHLPDGRYADGFYDALRYYGYKRGKNKNHKLTASS